MLVIIVATWFAFVVWTVDVIVNNQIDICSENQLIENIQAYVLGLACLIYLATALFDRKLNRLTLFSCFLLCYTCILREVNLVKLNVPYWFKLIGSVRGRSVTIIAAFIGILVYALLNNFPYHKNSAIVFIKSKAGVLLIAAGAFLVLGDYFEKSKAMAYHVYFEEITELFGYVLILLSSLAANSFMTYTAGKQIRCI